VRRSHGKEVDMINPPSVLFVLPWSHSAADGVSQVVINLAREAAKRDNLRPIIFCADPSLKTFQVGETEGVKLIGGRLRAPLSGAQPARNLATFARNLRDELQTWRAFLEEHNIRVVNAHHPSLDYSIFALLRARRAKIRLLFSLHGTDVTTIEKSGGAARPFARWMLNKADTVICCSEALEKRAKVSLKLDERRLTVIHNGIDVSELDQARTNVYKPDIGGFDDYLVNVAAYEHRKGQDILLHAYTNLLRNGLKSALVLIGRNTAYLQRLRGIARQLGLGDHVFFSPDLEHSQTLAAIRHARLLVQPSREEAFGLPLLEAAYLGTPIVATRTGGIPEVLGGYYPYLAEPDDPTALAAAIDEALFNPTDSKRQVKLMKRRVATGFTWGTAYNAYESAWSADAG
jgi:glycosyltransferase involved in cell wall biosynthesis